MIEKKPAYKRYIVLISVHGLIRAQDLELGRDADTGGQTLYATYLGGSGDDRIHDVAVDVSGNVYLGGETASEDFPLVNAVQG